MDATTRRTVSMGLGVSLAVSMYGVSFGALSVASGLDVWQTQVLSLLMFSGGSQFAVIGLVAAGASGFSAIASAALLGVRNTLYAVTIAPTVGGGFWRRIVAGHWTIDESTAVSIAQDDVRHKRLGFWITGAGIFVGWNLMTFVGAILGDALGDVRAYGLDAAAAAAFLGLLWPRLSGRDPIAIAVVAAVVTAWALPSLPPGVPVLVAAAVGLVAGLWLKRGRP
ncbi:putative branched-subunit amino acid permease [Microbacteriaceae bacterium MWH-Ta3]|nr:putative branched-subunit amino acid permease [Microbacteriaceae bacterium MWH-Ta3]